MSDPVTDVPSPSHSVLCRRIGGPEAEESSGFKGKLPSVLYTLGGVVNITVEVNNVLVDKEIHNVFGVIKGFTDPGMTVLHILCLPHMRSVYMDDDGYTNNATAAVS